MYARDCTRSRVRVAEEVLPLRSSSADAAFQFSDPIPIVYGADTARTYHRRYNDKRAASPRKPRRQSPSASALSRKYVAYQVDDLKRTVSSLPPTQSSQRTVYGTLAANASTGGKGSYDPARMGERPEEEEPLLIVTPTSSTGADCSSNQSETESDSDTGSSNSASSSMAATVASAASSSLQSILRIRSGDFSCRRVNKQASVEFAIDVASDEEDEEMAPLRRKKPSRACASRCVPRRLTIEEKTALYRVRPDLELTPMPVLLQELEEVRRRRQRKIVFSSLGAALMLLMIVVFYYTISQMDE